MLNQNWRGRARKFCASICHKTANFRNALPYVYSFYLYRAKKVTPPHWVVFTFFVVGFTFYILLYCFDCLWLFLYCFSQCLDCFFTFFDFFFHFFSIFFHFFKKGKNGKTRKPCFLRQKKNKTGETFVSENKYVFYDCCLIKNLKKLIVFRACPFFLFSTFI